VEKVVRIVSKKDRHTDREYWLNKTPQERLDALEELRMQYIRYLYPDALPRLQRVYRVVKKK
jgi:hypothetical protein